MADAGRKASRQSIPTRLDCLFLAESTHLHREQGHLDELVLSQHRFDPALQASQLCQASRGNRPRPSTTAHFPRRRGSRVGHGLQHGGVRRRLQTVRREESCSSERALAVAAVALLAGPAAAAQSAENNVVALQHFYQEAVNRGHLELFDEFLAENFVEHEDLPGLLPNRAGVIQRFALVRTAFPDLAFDVEFTMADGDKVAAYLTMSGTQGAEFLGIQSQGRTFRVKTVDILRFQNGKTVEHWCVTDTGVTMQQLTGQDTQAK